MEEGRVNGNPWGIFEAEWKENISDGLDRRMTVPYLCDCLWLLRLRGSKTSSMGKKDGLEQ